MATQVMYRPVGKRPLQRFMPFPKKPYVELTILNVFVLAACCVGFRSEVEKLKGTYGLLQMLRMVAVAHIFRFFQSIVGGNKVTPSFYLRRVLPHYDLPITLVIAAFYISIGTFPMPLDFVKILPLCLLLLVLVFRPKVFTQASPWNTELVDQQDDAAAIDLILPIIKFFRMEAKDTVDIEFIAHFPVILLKGMCFDLVVQVERVRGTYELIHMVLVLVGSHLFYIIEFFVGSNIVTSHYYLRMDLLFHDILFTATSAVFCGNFGTPSASIILVFILELLLGWVHISISKRENLKVTQGTEPEQDIRPTQASSSNTEKMLPQQNHDAANDLIFDRVNRDLSAANKESAVSAPISISETTDFSTWKRGKRIGAGGFGAVYILHDRENRCSCAVKELKDIHDTKSIESLIKEINILGQLKRHPNIVKYYNHKKDGSRICLYMEYIEPGSLKQYISKRGVLDKPLIEKFTAQILFGDLKPDNILVDSGDIVKLVDFGLAKKLAESVGEHSVLGTLYYAAPEVLKKIEYKNPHEASAADIWSLGCVIIAMFSGKHPWPDFEPVNTS